MADGRMNKIKTLKLVQILVLNNYNIDASNDLYNLPKFIFY